MSRSPPIILALDCLFFELVTKPSIDATASVTCGFNRLFCAAMYELGGVGEEDLFDDSVKE